MDKDTQEAFERMLYYKENPPQDDFCVNMRGFCGQLNKMVETASWLRWCNDRVEPYGDKRFQDALIEFFNYWKGVLDAQTREFADKYNVTPPNTTSGRSSW